MYGLTLIVVGGLLALGAWFLGRPVSEEAEAHPLSNTLGVTGKILTRVCLAIAGLGVIVLVVELIAKA